MQVVASSYSGTCTWYNRNKKDLIEDMYHFEDFHTGDTFELGPLTVTEEEIIAFANQFDPQYFHNDPQRAKGSIFGGLIASGWHVGSLYMRMFFDEVLSKTDSIGSPGIDQVRWLLTIGAS